MTDGVTDPVTDRAVDAAGHRAGSSGADRAPVLFRHPRIHTGVVDARPVSAVLAVNGRVLAVGDARELGRRAPTGTRVVDLEGAAVVPGLYDAHIHSASSARVRDAVDLRGTTDLADALQRIRHYAADHPGTGWLLGGGWDANVWTPPQTPHRTALDSACPDRPALLSSIDAHSAWANTAALQAAGIHGDTPDPAGGVIVRDPDGLPTGILREHATGVVRRAIPAEEPQHRRSLLLRGQQHLLSLGLTSIYDIDGEDARADYLAIHRAGELLLRVTKAIPVEHLDAAIAEGRRTGDGDAWFSTGAVKVFGDGALGSRTCLMTRPFADDPANSGVAVTSVEEMTAFATAATAAGIAVATHAIGDLANRRVIDVYEQLAARRPSSLRMRIEHTQFLRPEDVARMGRLGIVASMQPTHCTTDRDLVDRVLDGHDLVAYGWRSLLGAGAPLAFGSDAPVEDPNPFPGLHAAITRTRVDGTPAGGWQPQERLTPAQALAAHTVGSAYATGEEHRKGRLVPGLLADLVAVDTDPLGPEVDALPTARVLTTVIGGRVAWQRDH